MTGPAAAPAAIDDFAAARQLYALIHPPLLDGETVEARFIHPTEKTDQGNARIERAFHASHTALLCDLARHRDAWHCYVGAIVRRGRDGTKQGASRAGACYADIDAKLWQDAPDPKAAARAAIAAFPIAPTALVDSGGGLQPYWALREPVALDSPGATTRVERVNQWLACALCGPERTPDSVFDVARILRVPDTFNRKPVYPGPLPVHLLWLEPSRRYSLDELEARLATQFAWARPAEKVKRSAPVPSVRFSFDAADIVEKIRRSPRTAAALDGLWGDDLHSEALAHIVWRANFWAHDDEALLEQVVRQGFAAGYDPKWETSSNGTTWLRDDIRRHIEDYDGEYYSGPPACRRDAIDELIALGEASTEAPPSELLPLSVIMTDSVEQDIPLTDPFAVQQHMALLTAIIARQVTMIDRLRAERDEARAVNRGTAAVLANKELQSVAPTAVATALELASAIQRGRVDDEGFVRVVVSRVAERAGVSTKTVGRHFDQLTEWKAIEHKTVDRTIGGATRTEVWVKPESLAPTPGAQLDAFAEVARPEGAKRHGGGDRFICPNCGTRHRIKKQQRTTTRYRCDGCGEYFGDLVGTTETVGEWRTVAVQEPEPIAVGHHDRQRTPAAAGQDVRLSTDDSHPPNVDPQQPCRTVCPPVQPALIVDAGGDVSAGNLLPFPRRPIVTCVGCGTSVDHIPSRAWPDHVRPLGRLCDTCWDRPNTPHMARLLELSPPGPGAADDAAGGGDA